MNRKSVCVFGIPLLAVGLLATSASAQWVQFVDETQQRLVAAPGVGSSDPEEKDYDWGDLNNNGWIDLVVARKQPFTSSGRKINVLFMNERGVLVDRTSSYMIASDVEGDQGFNTPTNDRDIRVVDVDNDGWKDVVTATTLSDGQPKHISHPRVYMNLGENGSGEWQGFLYEDARIPQLEGIVQGGPHAGAPHAPRFCSVAAGDVTGDGFADLYFGDYDQGGGQTLDFNDRLLINNGSGFFADESNQRVQSSWLESSFGTQSIIADLNGNGVNDIVKVNSLGAYHTAAIYNDPNNEGFFQSHQIIQNSSTYFAMVGDLNKSGRLDIVIVDDGNDRWRINQGNLPNGQVNWSSAEFLSQAGFRSNIVLADLNNDTWLDILIADIDVDLGSCGGGGAADIYRHNQNPNNVNFTHDRGNLSSSDLQKTFDMAVFDLNGNGWKDLIAGRCGGMRIYMNQPQFGIDYSYPQGRPLLLDPSEVNQLVVEIDAFGQDLVPGTATLHVAVNDGPFSEIALSGIGQSYTGTFPALECFDNVRYYVSAELTGGSVVTDPPNAPTAAFTAVAAEGTEVVLQDDIQGSVSGWTVQSDQSLTGGEWEQAVPVATICCGGSLASPDGDASPMSLGKAFTTENCQPGQFPGSCNVDGGPTYLISPSVDLTGADAIISYDRWFFCSHQGDSTRADYFVTEVSNDGGKTWVQVHETGGTNSSWETASFLVSDYVQPTSTVQLRFSTEDEGNSSITNAGVDNLVVDKIVCGPAGGCTGDLNGDEMVDVSDLLALLGEWGPCSGCSGDLTGDGQVDVADLLEVLGAWGACE